jgi:hypothetical protein
LIQAAHLPKSNTRVALARAGRTSRTSNENNNTQHTTIHNYQHQIAVFATARKTINYIFNPNVPARQRDTVEAFCRTLYGDSALRAIPSAKSFTFSSAAATSFHLRHVLHPPLQMTGLEPFDTASNFMRDTTTTTHLSTRHDAARDAECRAALEVGALRALPEPGNIVNSIEDPTFELNLGGAVQLEKHGKTAFDISTHHLLPFPSLVGR